MTYTLYQRLGEAKGIAHLVDDVMAAHLVNPLIKTRFDAIKDLERTKRMARAFLGAGSGGTDRYTGKDMVAAAHAMNISAQEYRAVTDDIVDAMDKHKFDEETKSDLIAILQPLKSAVIRVSRSQPSQGEAMQSSSQLHAAFF
jgi:hemoglobin